MWKRQVWGDASECCLFGCSCIGIWWSPFTLPCKAHCLKCSARFSNVWQLRCRPSSKSDSEEAHKQLSFSFEWCFGFRGGMCIIFLSLSFVCNKWLRSVFYLLSIQASNMRQKSVDTMDPSTLAEAKRQIQIPSTSLQPTRFEPETFSNGEVRNGPFRSFFSFAG